MAALVSRSKALYYTKASTAIVKQRVHGSPSIDASYARTLLQHWELTFEGKGFQKYAALAFNTT